MNRAARYALGLIIEEIGEILQLIGKALRFGIDSPGVKRLDGSVDMKATARTMLPIEVGDLDAALAYGERAGLIDPSVRYSRAVEKLTSLLDSNARDNLGRRLAPDPSEANGGRDE